MPQLQVESSRGQSFSLHPHLQDVWEYQRGNQAERSEVSSSFGRRFAVEPRSLKPSQPLFPPKLFQRPPDRLPHLDDGHQPHDAGAGLMLRAADRKSFNRTRYPFNPLWRTPATPPAICIHPSSHSFIRHSSAPSSE